MKNSICRILSALLCILILLSAAACGKKTPDAPKPDTPTISDSPTVSDTTADNGFLHAEVTDDIHFMKFKTFYNFGDDEYEDYMLWCDSEMTDFHIVALIMDTDKWITDGVRLFEMDRISPDDSVNYRRMVPEGFPAEAVIYTANGKKYMYAISYNGRDGGISLIEIDTLFVDSSISSATAEKDDSETNKTTEKTTKKTTKKTTEKTTAATEKSKEIVAEIYWVNDDLEMFAREMTIESDSKWHVWKALKSLNPQIPSKCSLKSGEMVKGRNGIMELDFSSEFMDVGSSMTGRTVLQAIANTYITTYNLQAVRFMVEGKYLESAICGYSEEFAYTDC